MPETIIEGIAGGIPKINVGFPGKTSGGIPDEIPKISRKEWMGMERIPEYREKIGDLIKNPYKNPRKYEDS